MAINRSLRERPIKNLNRETLTNPDEMEKLTRWTSESILSLDQRRIAQQPAVVAGATDAITIVNLLNAVNALITALNGSSLTED